MMNAWMRISAVRVNERDGRNVRDIPEVMKKSLGDIFCVFIKGEALIINEMKPRSPLCK